MGGAGSPDRRPVAGGRGGRRREAADRAGRYDFSLLSGCLGSGRPAGDRQAADRTFLHPLQGSEAGRSEEHMAELQSLMRISYAVFCMYIKNISLSTTTNAHDNK